MKDFNEASASINVSMVSPKGFNPQFTIRGESMIKLLESYDTLETLLIEKGFKPAPQRSFGGGFPKKEKEWIVDKCPKDGGRLYHLVTKSGKDMCKCENSTFVGGVAGGCPFIAWGKNLADAKAKQVAWEQAQTQGSSDINPFFDDRL